MRMDIVSLFPEMCEAVLGDSIVGRARRRGYMQICMHRLRNFAQGKHSQVDDCPFGGGKGMLLKAEPIAACLDKITEHLSVRPHIIYMSPKGKALTQARVVQLSKMSNIAVLCGHYEGVDERVLESYVDEEISIGDYVLTGGEMPAIILADAVSRMLGGVLAEDLCFEEESHFAGLLEHPQYTRPSEWRGMKVPRVLLSGDHKKVESWKRETAIMRTAKFRPDMLKAAQLSEKEQAAACSLVQQEEEKAL